jgi:hypothetical protein
MTEEPYPDEVPTAYRSGESLEVRCVICDGLYMMKPGKCPNDECGSELLSAETESKGACMKCGWTADDWDDHIHWEERQGERRAAFLRLLGKRSPTHD